MSAKSRSSSALANPRFLLVFLVSGLAAGYATHAIVHASRGQYTWSLEDLLVYAAGFLIGGTIGWLIARRLTTGE